MKTALISVSDKTGAVAFARGLAALDYRILSTGGTARLLAAEGLTVTEVADYTGFPEILDGRVKTLNPRIHAGLLARHDVPAHMKALAEHGIDRIEVIAVNLYPFEATVAKPDCTFDDAIENIDIGGPAMLRASAKNHGSVTVVVDPADYTRVLDAEGAGGADAALRLELACKVFAHTARYDGMIANHLSSLDAQRKPARFPRVLTRQWQQVQTMRYGENPHQGAAFYRDGGDPARLAGLIASYRQFQGKELSYNNIADADAAWECVRSFAGVLAQPLRYGENPHQAAAFYRDGSGRPGVATARQLQGKALSYTNINDTDAAFELVAELDPAGGPACAIIKHANPCGVARGG